MTDTLQPHVSCTATDRSIGHTSFSGTDRKKSHGSSIATERGHSPFQYNYQAEATPPLLEITHTEATPPQCLITEKRYSIHCECWTQRPCLQHWGWLAHISYLQAHVVLVRTFLSNKKNSCSESTLSYHKNKKWLVVSHHLCLYGEIVSCYKEQFLAHISYHLRSFIYTWLKPFVPHMSPPPPTLLSHVIAGELKPDPDIHTEPEEACPVCGDRVSGYHYGLLTCESCKASQPADTRIYTQRCF